MKPINFNQRRVLIGIGDFIYLMGEAKMYFVKEVRANRREISSGAITEADEVEISGDAGWAKGTLPGRIVHVLGMAINDTSGNGRVTDLKLGNKSILSEENVESVVLDTNTCGVSGGSGAIGQVRWGELPLDMFLWDSQTLKATCNTAGDEVTFAMDFDVREYNCKAVTLAEVEQANPSNVVLASRLGANRVAVKDFLKIQSWL